ncbi:hypothetical protein MAR_011129 [Mya arenaria]|uniref:Uncharacterized protein n=1 Tax=Mya arenaria TaxID=6604 RepID=A0ABY7FTV0_MYAAR|nr:hypothetical protein MAR_011129 [Mya arenaria]
MKCMFIRLNIDTTIRVVNAFRMGLDMRYDSHSLTSQRSHHSLQSSGKTHKPHPTSPLASPDTANPTTSL